MKKVEIYTSNSCIYCHEAKEFLQEKNVPYVEHNISKDIEARKTLMAKGYRGVPVIIIDDEAIVGFEKEELEVKLGL